MGGIGGGAPHDHVYVYFKPSLEANSKYTNGHDNIAVMQYKIKNNKLYCLCKNRKVNNQYCHKNKHVENLRNRKKN